MSFRAEGYLFTCDDLSHHLRHKHGLDMNKVIDMIAKDDVDMKIPITCLYNKYALITYCFNSSNFKINFI